MSSNAILPPASNDSPDGPMSLVERRERVVARGVPRATDTAIVKARGARLIDQSGRSYIDFAGGIGVVNAGHCPDSVVAAIKAQAEQLLHAGIHITTYEGYVALCERLVALLPHGKSTKAMLINSGAEAIENAVKIARQATGRGAVICFTGGFHGRTLLGMTLTSQTKYKQRCGPFASDIYRVPFPDALRDTRPGESEQSFTERVLRDFEEIVSTYVNGSEIAAVLIEPVLGEGGFVPTPPGYLAGLRSFTTRHGAMLIFDEVQTGFGRTGHWGAYQHYNVTPDLSTWAKSMGGGLPIAAVVGRADVMDAAAVGTIGGTFGGNPVACAAALANIKVIEQLGLLARARAIGDQVRAAFTQLAKTCPTVVDVRGIGAMIGAELCIGGDVYKPATDLTKQILANACERGVIALAAGVHGNTIRVLSPLVITDEDLDAGLAIITDEIRRNTT